MFLKKFEFYSTISKAIKKKDVQKTLIDHIFKQTYLLLSYSVSELSAYLCYVKYFQYTLYIQNIKYSHSHESNNQSSKENC